MCTVCVFYRHTHTVCIYTFSEWCLTTVRSTNDSPTSGVIGIIPRGFHQPRMVYAMCTGRWATSKNNMAKPKCSITVVFYWTLISIDVLVSAVFIMFSLCVLCISARSLKLSNWISKIDSGQSLWFCAQALWFWMVATTIYALGLFLWLYGETPGGLNWSSSMGKCLGQRLSAPLTKRATFGRMCHLCMDKHVQPFLYIICQYIYLYSISMYYTSIEIQLNLWGFGYATMYPEMRQALESRHLLQAKATRCCAGDGKGWFQGWERWDGWIQ